MIGCPSSYTGKPFKITRCYRACQEWVKLDEAGCDCQAEPRVVYSPPHRDAPVGPSAIARERCAYDALHKIIRGSLMKRLFPFVWFLALLILVPIAVSPDGDMVYCCLRSCT